MSDLIESLVEKVSAYSIFNFLLPGVIFATTFELITQFTVFTGNIIVDIVITYFTGMVLSRIGSLVVEPIFKSIRIIKFAQYEDYLTAEKKDSKLITLLQENNIYRNMTTVFLTLLIVKIGMPIQQNFPNFHLYFNWVWPIALLFLFAISYRKQTAYIHKRITTNKK